MKKIISFIAALTVSLSVLTASGCDDFAFNPIGNWMLTDDIVLDENNKEIVHVVPETMMFQEMLYTFEKSGTGYMSVNGDRTIDFKYEYNDKTVTITSDDTNTSVEYELSKDKTQLIRSLKQVVPTEDGNKEYTEKIIMTKK